MHGNVGATVVFIVASVVLCGVFTAVIMVGMRNPIKGIMSYPPAIRDRVESLPQYADSIDREKREHIGKKLMAIPVYAIVSALVVMVAGISDFWGAFAFVMGLSLAVNLWDLIVLDWLWFCRSPAVRIPGTEDMDKEYRDPWYHLRGFCIGIAVAMVIGVLGASIVVGLGAAMGR